MPKHVPTAGSAKDETGGPSPDYGQTLNLADGDFCKEHESPRELEPGELESDSESEHSDQKEHPFDYFHREEDWPQSPERPKRTVEEAQKFHAAQPGFRQITGPDWKLADWPPLEGPKPKPKTKKASLCPVVKKLEKPKQSESEDDEETDRLVISDPLTIDEEIPPGQGNRTKETGGPKTPDP